MPSVRERAEELYRADFNCAQSVLYAFCPVTGMDEKEALRLASSFGGGMGNLKEVCGALTGAFMVAGLLKGFTGASSQRKREHNLVVQGVAEAFRNRFDSLLCRDLLQRNNDDGSVRTEPKPCLKYVLGAVEIAGEVLGCSV